MFALKALRELALENSRKRHPNLPESVRSCRNYSDKSANGLTKCVIDFLRFSGHQAERVSSSGRYLDNSKVITDTLGFKRRIGSGKWIPGSMQKGSADISATINGRSVKIEIKMQDKQSEAQRKYQEQVELAGGKYWLVRSFDQFLTYYNDLKA
jgi:hypothetical protein